MIKQTNDPHQQLPLNELDALKAIDSVSLMPPQAVSNSIMLIEKIDFGKPMIR